MLNMVHMAEVAMRFLQCEGKIKLISDRAEDESSEGEAQEDDNDDDDGKIAFLWFCVGPHLFRASRAVHQIMDIIEVGPIEKVGPWLRSVEDSSRFADQQVHMFPGRSQGVENPHDFHDCS